MALRRQRPGERESAFDPAGELGVGLDVRGVDPEPARHSAPTHLHRGRARPGDELVRLVGIDADEEAALAARGNRHVAADEEAFKAPLREQYETQGSPYYATARLWDDGIIDPADTRRILGMALDVCATVPLGEPRLGLFRM